MPGNEPKGSESELRERLDSLTSALGRAEAAEKAAAEPAGPDKALAGAMSSGFRAATDMAGGVIAGALLGYFGDRWLGTSPFLLIAFLVIGTIAGLRSAYRLGTRPSTPKGDGPRN